MDWHEEVPSPALVELTFLNPSRPPLPPLKQNAVWRFVASYSSQYAIGNFQLPPANRRNTFFLSVSWPARMIDTGRLARVVQSGLRPQSLARRLARSRLDLKPGFGRRDLFLQVEMDLFGPYFESVEEFLRRVRPPLHHALGCLRLTPVNPDARGRQVQPDRRGSFDVKIERRCFVTGHRRDATISELDEAPVRSHAIGGIGEERKPLRLGFQ